MLRFAGKAELDLPGILLGFRISGFRKNPKFVNPCLRHEEFRRDRYVPRRPASRLELSDFCPNRWFAVPMSFFYKEAEAAGHFVRFHDRNQSETQKGNRNMRFTQY